MIDFFFSVKKRVFVHFRTETLRTKLEPVHFRSGIESRVFFSGKKKVNHYENESILNNAMHIYVCVYFICVCVIQGEICLWRN